MLIAFVNQKGGVGKTTLAVHLAAWLHDAGRRTALIDADGQASSSSWLRVAAPEVNIIVEQRADELIESVGRLAETAECIVADGPANLSETSYDQFLWMT
ncbi:MAG: AAA family ATPase [Phycisphaerales bacterium]|nr:AAA family ATPase [Phycisphaerales bacterium]